MPSAELVEAVAKQTFLDCELVRFMQKVVQSRTRRSCGSDQPPTMSTPDQPRFRALLLEDDAECATLCEVLLGLEGATVDSAKTIAEATSLAGQNSYDLFILDHNLPDG